MRILKLKKRKRRKKQPEHKKRLSDHLQEWTKVVIFIMLIIYVIGTVYMAVLCWRSTEQAYNLADVLKTPISVGIIGYLLKAGAENVFQGLENGEVDTPPTPDETDCNSVG